MSKIKIVKFALGMIAGFVGAKFLLGRKARKIAPAQEPVQEI